MHLCYFFPLIPSQQTSHMRKLYPLQDIHCFSLYQVPIAFWSADHHHPSTELSTTPSPCWPQSEENFTPDYERYNRILLSGSSPTVSRLHFYDHEMHYCLTASWLSHHYPKQLVKPHYKLQA